MGVPVGDVARSFVNPQSWLGKILAFLKGISINVRGTQIDLDQAPGIGQTEPGTTTLDSKPADLGAKLKDARFR